MMPFLAKFSSEYLLWVSLLPEFKEFLDNAVRLPVGGLGWPGAAVWDPSGSLPAQDILCAVHSSPTNLLCAFPRQTKEVRPSKAWISSSSSLWPWRHFGIAQAPAVKISPISSRVWNVEVFEKTMMELGNFPLSTVSRDWEFQRQNLCHSHPKGNNLS